MQTLTIDYTLRVTWQAVQKMYNEKASTYDATMSQAFTLLCIDPKKGTPSTSLGPMMGVEATSLSRTLKQMEEKKYIKRTSNPKDGRSVLIKLTREGLKKRDICKKEVFDFNEHIVEKISPIQLQHFNEVMECIYNYTQEANNS